jgi:hypothetical protein
MNQPTSASDLACSLSAAEGTERAARWRALLETRLLSRAETAFGQRLAFRSDEAVAAELDTLIAAERDCCSFLTLSVERFDDALILDVTGPPDAAPIVQAMFGEAA